MFKRKLLILPLLPLVFSLIMCSTSGKTVTYHSQKLSRLLEESEPGDTRFEFNVHTHNMYYKRISENLKAMEEAYKECLDSLSNSNYTEESVENCVGKDMIYVINDINYERRQMIGRADEKMRSYMIENCYKRAEGIDGANNCDLLERDVLELLWNELNFGLLVDYHRAKYVKEAAQVPVEDFERIADYLTKLHNELKELLEEVDDHSIIIRANLKKIIDMRTRVILEEAQESVKNPLPKIIKHNIEIEERLNNPNYLDVTRLPRAAKQDGTRTMFAMKSNPEVEKFYKQHGDILAREDITQPIVTLPERRLNLDGGSKEDKENK